YFIDGRLDPESGAAVQTALNALSLPYPGDRRTPQQRRADALIELCHRHFQAGTLPEVGGQRPHLLVKVFASALAGTPGSPAGDLNWGGSVPAATVRRLACDATLSVVALDEDGQPLDGGRATRIISPSMRRALIARDGGCRFPSCDRPIDWTDAHHLRHWADGGETTKDNLVLLCRNHHHLIHAGGWQMVRGEGGAWVAIPPDRKGRAHPDPPASRSA
ncbi:MAG TPA: DUF222 domain-containing protein, partial [Candidatus Sulfotelmatobacter sp.]|nr:DUF222 domain-containing protein [Candidatus Sulfotelmatobacter sp.]